jgi:LysM repeat protein
MRIECLRHVLGDGLIFHDDDLAERTPNNPALSESTPLMSMKRPVLLIVAACVLAACETPPPAAPKRDPVPSAPREAEPPAAPPAPVITAPPAPAGPVTPVAQQQAQKIALAAADMLESGNEEQARTELKRALAADPQNKLAQNLSRQLVADPVAVLGRESFPYTVRSSDTLSRIAQRFLGDVYAFYILARYNDIKVPKQVSGGQVIRVPGKAPPPGSTATAPAAESLPRKPPPSPAPAPEPAPAPAPAPVASPPPAPPPEPTPGERAMRNAAAAERAADLPRARAEYLVAASYNQPGAAAKAEQLRSQLVTRYGANARGALARQDLDGAIGNWQRVLDLDPENTTARLELERVRSLKEKLKNVK